MNQQPYQPDAMDPSAAKSRNLGFAHSTDWDAVVIGAGPAGSVTAIQLARSGYRVLLVDKAAFPRTKVCGSCLSGKAVRVLRELNLDSVFQHAIPLTRFRLGSRQKIVSLKTDGGYAISRSLLDLQLARLAESEGVTFLDGTTAELGDPDSGLRSVRLRNKVEQTTTNARLVMVCSGLGNAGLNGSLPIEETISSNPSIGVTCLLPKDDRYEAGQIEMSVNGDGYVGVTVVEDGRVNVSAAIRKRALRGSQRVGQVVENIIRSAGMTLPEFGENTGWQGTRELTREVLVPGAENVLMVGDAAGYVEPFTGEGMAWAMEAACQVQPFAQQAIENWDAAIVDKWAAVCGKHGRIRKRTCQWIKLVAARPTMVTAAIRLLRYFPGLARPFIRSIHGKRNLSLEVSK